MTCFHRKKGHVWLRSRLLASQGTKLVRGFQRTAGMVGHAIVGRPQTTTSRTYVQQVWHKGEFDGCRGRLEISHSFTSKNVLWMAASLIKAAYLVLFSRRFFFDLMSSRAMIHSKFWKTIHSHAVATNVNQNLTQMYQWLLPISTSVSPKQQGVI